MPRSPRQLLDSSRIHGVSPDDRRLARVTYFRAGAPANAPDQSGELSLRRNGTRTPSSEPEKYIHSEDEPRETNQKGCRKTRAQHLGSPQ